MSLLNSLRIALPKEAFLPGEHATALVELELIRQVHVDELRWECITSTYQLARRRDPIRIGYRGGYSYPDGAYNISRVVGRTNGLFVQDRDLEEAVWQFDLPFRVLPHRPSRMAERSKYAHVQLAVVATLAKARDLRAWAKVPIMDPSDGKVWV